MEEIFADLHVHIGRSESGKPIKITAARSLNFANIAKEYATKRYRSNVINWGMIPFLLDNEPEFDNGTYIFVPNILNIIESEKMDKIPAYILGKEIRQIDLHIAPLTPVEKETVKAGCLINFNRNKAK